jgi:hypothetical protein
MQLQDTLLAYIRKNLRKMVNFFLSSMPEGVTISDSMDVHNAYVLPRELSENDIRNFDE